MLHLLMLPLFIQLSLAAFVESFPVNVYNSTTQQFKPFVIYVALDTKMQFLKFFINTKVFSHMLSKPNGVAVSDVNPETNRYTTLHIDIDFMGKKFVLENLRLCEVLAVKNTSLYENTPRFFPIDLNDFSSNRPESLLPTSLPYYHPNETPVSTFRKKSSKSLPPTTNSSCLWCGSEADIFLATSNTSISNYFSNSTEPLIQCPLYQNDSVIIYYQVDVRNFTRKIGSYTAKFTIVSNAVEPAIIGGARCYVTPVVQPRSFESAIFYFVLALLLIANGLNFFIMAFSPDQESSNPFFNEASTICNKRLLEQLESSTDRIISYLQFALFMGGLNIQYPGFYQPLIGQIRWCSLLGFNILNKEYSVPSPHSDNAYVTLNFSGLKSLSLYSSNGLIQYSWLNFMICLIIWMAITIFVYQFFIALKLAHLKLKVKVKGLKHFLKCEGKTDSEVKDTTKKIKSNYSISRNAWALFGSCLRVFLSTFGFVFLLLTIFMLYSAGTFSSMHFTEDKVILRLNAFDPTFPYDSLIPDQPPTRNVYVISTKDIAGGVISLFLWFALAFFFIIRYLVPLRNWQIRLSADVSKLYTSVQTIITWAYLYSTYKPSRVHYVIIDLLGVVLSLLVIGGVQSNGTAQVICIIIIELVQLILLFIIRPLFLKLSWHSLPWITRLARFAIAILSVLYIRQLAITEASRTYVAYTQLIIHTTVVAIYVANLIYCSSLMLRALFKKPSSCQPYGAPNASDPESLDDLLLKDDRKKPFSPFLFNLHTIDNSVPLIGDADDEEVDYYRSRTGNMFLDANATLSQVDVLDQKKSNSENIFTEGSASTTKDYTTREADRVYQIGLSDPNIDPEIRKMWQNRESVQCNIEREEPESAFFSGFKSLFRRNPPKETGFQVSRPRPLVVSETPSLQA